MLNTLNSAYEILHLWGYYDRITSVKVVNEDFNYAFTLINQIKPLDIEN